MADGGETPWGKDNAHGVVALGQHGGDIVGVEIDALGVIAQGWFHQFLFCYFLPVEEGLILAEAADVKACAVDTLVQMELVAQVACGNGGMAFDFVVRIVAANPACPPVGGTEQTDFEALHLALYLSPLVLVAIGDGGKHFPVGYITALQLAPLIGDVEHLAGGGDLRVPKVAHALFGLLPGGGDDNPVVRLHDIRLVCLILPAETGSGRGQRLRAILPLDGQIFQFHSTSTGGKQEGGQDDK